MHTGLKAPFLAILTFANRVFGTETTIKTRGFEPLLPTAITLESSIAGVDSPITRGIVPVVLIKRGGGTGPVKPRQPRRALNSAFGLRVPNPADTRRNRVLEDESEAHSLAPLQGLFR